MPAAVVALVSMECRTIVDHFVFPMCQSVTRRDSRPFHQVHSVMQVVGEVGSFALLRWPMDRVDRPSHDKSRSNWRDCKSNEAKLGHCAQKTPFSFLLEDINRLLDSSHCRNPHFERLFWRKAKVYRFKPVQMPHILLLTWVISSYSTE